jgi:hypothetical protein
VLLQNDAGRVMCPRSDLYSSSHTLSLPNATLYLCAAWDHSTRTTGLPGVDALFRFAGELAVAEVAAEAEERGERGRGSDATADDGAAAEQPVDSGESSLWSTMRASEGEELGCTPRCPAVLPTTYTKAHKLPAPSSSHHCIICRLAERNTNSRGRWPAVQGAEGRWPQVVLESERGLCGSLDRPEARGGRG